MNCVDETKEEGKLESSSTSAPPPPLRWRCSLFIRFYHALTYCQPLQGQHGSSATPDSWRRAGDGDRPGTDEEGERARHVPTWSLCGSAPLSGFFIASIDTLTSTLTLYLLSSFSRLTFRPRLHRLPTETSSRWSPTRSFTSCSFSPWLSSKVSFLPCYPPPSLLADCLCAIFFLSFSPPWSHRSVARLKASSRMRRPHPVEPGT